MAKKFGTTHIYNTLVQSFGVFIERPTDMDMFFTTEAHPEGTSPGISLSFQVGKFGISAYINLYSKASKEEDDILRVMLYLTHDDHPDKVAYIYQNEDVPNVLGKGFMQNKILEVMAGIDPEYKDPKKVLERHLVKGRFNAGDAASAFQKATRQYGYASWRFNNYKKGQKVSYQIELGTPIGQVKSRSTGEFVLGERVPVIREGLEAFLNQATSKYIYVGNVHKL